MTPEQRKAVYDQDCESYRYRDRLKWDRFQTAYAIEAGALYGAFAIPGLPKTLQVALIVVATAFFLLIYRLVKIDENDCRAFLLRKRNYETSLSGLAPLELNRRAGEGSSVTLWIVSVACALNLAALIYRCIH